jgi:hypothetical protein
VGIRLAIGWTAGANAVKACTAIALPVGDDPWGGVGDETVEASGGVFCALSCGELGAWGGPGLIKEVAFRKETGLIAVTLMIALPRIAAPLAWFPAPLVCFDCSLF